MDDLPKDLARPRRDWPIADVMGIVVGAALFLALIGGLAWWVMAHG